MGLFNGLFGVREMGDKEALERAAEEVKRLANAQRTHVGRFVGAAPIDLTKLKLPTRAVITKHETGYIVSADPDEHPDAVKADA